MMQNVRIGGAMVRGLALAAGMAASAAAFSAAADEAATIDALPVEQIEKIVRDYLMREPEVVYHALEELQRRQTAEQAERQKQVLTSRKDELLNDPATPIVGNPEGDVTLVEFFDYRCSFCRRVLPSMQALIAEDQGLRVAFKELPVLGEDSVRASRASLAGQRQDPDLYLDFHLALMAAKDLSAGGIRAIATDVGLDPDQLEHDMASDAVTKIIEANYQLASALGIEGTPAFVVGETLVPGAVDKARLTQLIGEARTAAAN